MSQAADQTLEILRQKLREQMNNLTNHLADGSCDSYENYCRVTGEIAGLARAEYELLELDEKLLSE